MKTPREILLARHQAANSKLDRIRQAAVADLAKRSAEPRPSIPFALKLWQELIWPCRRTWASLAAVWLAITAFNLSHSESRQTVTAINRTSPTETRLAYQEQKRLLDELLGPTATPLPAAAQRPPNNRPRSEWRKTAQG